MAQAAGKSVTISYSDSSGELIETIVEEEISLAPLMDLIQNFIDQSGVAIQGFRVTLKRKILEGELPSAIDDVIDNAHFISVPPLPFQIVRLEQRYFPTSADFANARTAYRNNLLTSIVTGDLLVIVEWYPLGGDPFHTLAVLSPQGDVKCEPVLELFGTMTERVSPILVGRRLLNQPGERIVERLEFEWRNFAGVLKWSATLRVSALGGNDCSATFAAEGASDTAFPYVIQRQAPVVTLTQGSNSSCEGGYMQCGRAVLTWDVIFRIGISPLNVDLWSDTYNMGFILCANGTYRVLQF